MKPAEFLMCFEKYSIVINVGDGPYRVGIIDMIVDWNISIDTAIIM